ncbi:ATPase [Paraburkholderia phymatum]|uniref:ATPase n=1 Tax=Paraburkholderia phymatum TaxID=148447 RepID=UPI0031704D1D
MDNAAPFDEAHLLTDYTALRQRAAALEEQVPAYLQRISETLHRIGGESDLANHHRSLLVSARGNAMMAIENYHQAFPFLQTAGSLVEQLDRQPISFEGAEWRDALLQSLDELIDNAVVMIDEAELRFGEAKDPDPAAVPRSILDV